MHKKNGLVPDDVFMSKRLQVASMMAQGLVSSGGAGSLNQITTASYDLADALIAGENGEQSGWQERVIREESDLIVKISKLDDFIYGTNSPDIDPDDVELLVEQLDVMIEYDKILVTRISNF